MYRTLSIIVLSLALAACGGSGDSSSEKAPAATSTTTTSTTTASGSTSATTAPTDSANAPTATSAAADAPTTESSTSDSGDANNPDVHVPLSAGSSGEVESDNPDPMAIDAEMGTVKVTLVGIQDSLDNTFANAGNMFWGVEIAVEATSDKVVNTGVWTVELADGGEYESGYLPSIDNLTYGKLQPGETRQGVVVFEIPEGAVVTSVKMSPSIYVGGNLVFDAS